MQRSTIIATDDSIHQIVKDEISKYGDTADLNHIDVSHVTNMENLFGDSSFNGDIFQWNVSNVKYMDNMFDGAAFNGNISNWNVSSVKTMKYMFYASPFNGDISRWDVSNARYMSFMFKGSLFNGNISKWDVSNVTTMFALFKDSSFNGNISQWDVSNVTNMGSIFNRSGFKGDISNWSIHPDCDIQHMLTQKKFILPPLLRIDDMDLYTLRLREAFDYTGQQKLNIKASATKYPNPTVAHAIYLLLSSSKPQTIHPQFRTSDRKKLQMLYQLTGSVYQSVKTWEQQHNNATPPNHATLLDDLSRNVLT